MPRQTTESDLEWDEASLVLRFKDREAAQRLYRDLKRNFDAESDDDMATVRIPVECLGDCGDPDIGPSPGGIGGLDVLVTCVQALEDPAEEDGGWIIRLEADIYYQEHG